jgi:hypothetical protein
MFLRDNTVNYCIGMYKTETEMLIHQIHMGLSMLLQIGSGNTTVLLKCVVCYHDTLLSCCS